MNEYILVKVHPHARKDVLLSLGAERFEAWVRAKPLEGRANEAVVNLLARYLQLPHARIRLVKGHSGRSKVFRLLSM